MPDIKSMLMKLKGKHLIYWSIIAILIAVISGGAAAWFARQRQVAHDQQNAKQSTDNQTPTPVNPDVKQPQKITFKDKTETTGVADSDLVYEVVMLGDDGAPFAVKDPAYLSLGTDPVTSTRRVSGDGGGSIVIAAGASSTKVHFSETKVGTYKLTITFDSVASDTRNLTITPAEVVSITITGPVNASSAELASGVAYTASGTDQYGNANSPGFTFTIVKDAATTTTASGTTYTLKDSSAGCHQWTITVSRGTVSGSVTVSKSDNAGSACAYGTHV